MSDNMTRGDSVRAYNSGAGSAGAAQADPDASLGGFLSSSEINTYGMVITDPIADITVDFASGGNAPGAGNLECTGVDTLQWRDAGGAYGDVVTILDGETKVVEASGNPGAFVRVTRTSATPLVNVVSTITLSYVSNNSFGFDNVGSGEAVAGDDEYRCVMLQNVSAFDISSFRIWLKTLGTQRVSAAAQLGASGSGTIGLSAGNFDDWPAKGWCRIDDSSDVLQEIVYYESRTSTVLTVPANGRGLLGTVASAGAASDKVYPVPGIRIGLEPSGPFADTVAVQTIADESTAPIGVTWNTDISNAGGLNVGTVPSTEYVALWIHREIPAGAKSNTNILDAIVASFDAA